MNIYPYFLLIFNIFISLWILQVNAVDYELQLVQQKHSKPYPNLDGNSLIDANMRKLMRPYCIPLDHPLKQSLDAIFNASRVTENEETFADA